MRSNGSLSSPSAQSTFCTFDDVLRPQTFNMSCVQSIEAARGLAIELFLLLRAGALGHAFEGVPQCLVAAGRAVDREVAFEHAALRTERGDAGFEIGPPSVGKL